MVMPMSCLSSFLSLSFYVGILDYIQSLVAMIECLRIYFVVDAYMQTCAYLFNVIVLMFPL